MFEKSSSVCFTTLATEKLLRENRSFGIRDRAPESHLRLKLTLFKQPLNDWGKFDRLETKTCRPISDGQRITISDKAIIFAFLIDGLEEPVGRFRYFDINPRNRSAEFGYTINPKSRNQGLGTKMLITAIDYLLTTTELNKLYCQTAAFNIASVKLLDKLGFHRDGILREHHELDGKLWDDYIYSILRSEWKTSKFFNN